MLCFCSAGGCREIYNIVGWPKGESGGSLAMPAFSGETDPANGL